MVSGDSAANAWLPAALIPNMDVRASDDSRENFGSDSFFIRLEPLSNLFCGWALQ
jgi:hypothetical protein